MQFYRRYYIENWGFDPLKDRVELNQEGSKFRYEKAFKLNQDPILKNAGTLICARVDVNINRLNCDTKTQAIENFIVFKQDGKEEVVKCVHTIIFQGSLEDINKIGAQNLPQLLYFPQQQLIKLPPEEHFVSLQSYVKQLALIGMELHFIDLLRNRQDTYILRKKILFALYKLVPCEFLETIRSILKNIRVSEEEFFHNFPNITTAIEYFLK